MCCADAAGHNLLFLGGLTNFCCNATCMRHHATNAKSPVHDSHMLMANMKARPNCHSAALNYETCLPQPSPSVRHLAVRVATRFVDNLLESSPQPLSVAGSLEPTIPSLEQSIDRMDALVPKRVLESDSRAQGALAVKLCTSAAVFHLQSPTSLATLSVLSSIARHRQLQIAGLHCCTASARLH